ncbi:MAG: alpha/beta hydrolase [Legionellaceae bacterium]|nr:alpha/beta hydrolase [Legionellaceae bacterium]
MHSFTLSIPGYSIACKAYGNPHNPPMLALHGWLDNANSFDLIAPLFAHHFYFIAIDFPGHGLSTHLPHGYHYHIVDAISLIRDLLAALGFKKMHLLGHSMGACIASLAGGVLDDRIQSLFLIDGLGPLTAAAEECQTQLRQYVLHEPEKSRRTRSYASIKEAAQARARYGHISLAQARILCQRGTKKCDGQWFWRHDPRLLYSSPLRLTEEQTLSCLQAIEAPSALILAHDGFPFGEEVLRQRMAVIKPLHVFTVEGGHHVHMEHPEKIYAIARDFYHVS